MRLYSDLNRYTVLYSRVRSMFEQISDKIIVGCENRSAEGVAFVTVGGWSIRVEQVFYERMDRLPRVQR